MSKTIYTIGYAGFSREAFIAVLKKYSITVLIDVRSSPFSAFHPEYNKDVLETILHSNGIYYRNYAKEFGARQNDTKLYSSSGCLDFEKVTETTDFQNGLRKLCYSMEQGYVPVLMCAEIKPIDCHRSILVSKAFHECGCNVVHILPHNKTCSQNDIVGELLEKYFPNRNQISMFENLDEHEYIQMAYRRKNEEIGYRITEGDEV